VLNYTFKISTAQSEILLEEERFGKHMTGSSILV